MPRAKIRSAKPLEALTPRQRLVLGLIARHIRDRGMPPVVRWLMARLGIDSPNGVMSHLHTLVRKGYLERGTTNQARGRQISPAGWMALGLLSSTQMERVLLDVLDNFDPEAVTRAHQHFRALGELPSLDGGEEKS